MQTVLGSGGIVGIELARSLKSYSDGIKLVSRNPKKVNESDLLFSADLLNPIEVDKAVKNSEIVYLTVGLKYDYKTWSNQWPIIMKNTIEACIKNNCKLVFFDNIYVYDKDSLNRMTEETKINPPSKKGEIRKKIAEHLMSESKKGNIEALIARSADFYGPEIKTNSMLTEMVFKNISKKKKAMWLSSANFKHSFTFTPDAGKATAILGNSTNAFGQVWHLPTAKNPLTGKELIETISNEFKVEPKFRILSEFMLKSLGLFVPVLKEMVEMIYQYNRDYVFDSSKFEKAFNYKPTSYEEGIKQIIAKDY